MTASLHNDGLAGGPPKFFTFVESPSGAILIGSCVRGISRSSDGGVTWTPVGGLEHLSVNTLTVGVDGALLAATSGGLWRSQDDGTSWQQGDQLPAYTVLPDGDRGPADLTTFRLLQLRDGRRLAGTDGRGVWANDDGSWTSRGIQGSIVYSLAETRSGTLLAGTRGEGVFRSDDAGATWLRSDSGLPDVYVHCLVELRDGSMLAGTGHGVARSTNDGRSWDPYAADLDGHRIFSLCELADGRIAAGSYAHAWLSQDGSWRAVDPGLTPDETWSVLFGPDDKMYAGSKAGLLGSDDQGRTWQNLSPGPVVLGLACTSDGSILAVGDGGVRRGPDWTLVGDLEPRAMCLLEAPPGRFLAGTLSDGLYRYEDGVWGPVADGPPHWQVYAIIRTETGRLLAGTGAIIDGQKLGGVFSSDDDGETWVETLSGRSYYALATAADGTVYAGGRRCYISRSVDDGDTWELLPLPLGQEAKMYSLFVDHENTIFVGSGSQLLRSKDKGQSWTVLDDGIDGVSIYRLAEGSRGLLAAATTSGVLVSANGGDSWRLGELA